MSKINPVKTGVEKREEIIENSQLTGHREYVTDISAKIAGRKPIRRDEDVFVFYRIPTYQSLKDEKQLRNTKFGTFVLDDGHVLFDNGELELPIQIISNDPEAGIEFINSIRHMTETRRQRLGANANEDMEINGVEDRSSPKGPKAHLLSLYNKLSDQLETEHFRQRDRIQN